MFPLDTDTGKSQGRHGVFNTNAAGTARKFGVSLKGSFKIWGSERPSSEPGHSGRPWRTASSSRRTGRRLGDGVERFGGCVTVDSGGNGIGRLATDQRSLGGRRPHPSCSTATSEHPQHRPTGGCDTGGMGFNEARVRLLNRR